MNYQEIQLIVVSIFVINVLWIFCAIRYQRNKPILTTMIGILTIMFAWFLYIYEINLGYAVEEPLPETFVFLGFAQHDKSIFIWAIPPDSTTPRAYIVTNLNTEDKRKLRKAKQEVDSGVLVHGKHKGNAHDGKDTSSPTFEFEIVDPGQMFKK